MRDYKTLFIVLGSFVASLVGHSAQAQTSCTCPSGFTLIGSLCESSSSSMPAICTSGNSSSPAAVSQSAGQMISSQQQLSFSSLQSMLEGRRDQLQNRRSAGRPLGYANEDNGEVLGYAATARGSDAFASLPLKAPVRPLPSGPSWASWVEGLGDWQRYSAVTPGDLTHFTATYGAQGGVDATWQSLAAPDDALVFGIVASWTTSRITYNASPVSLQLNGPGVGLYGTYLRGNFSTDLAVKVDFLGLSEDFAGLTPNASISATNFGVSGNTQYRITTGGASFIEPTGGFSFTRATFANGAAALDLQDASTLRLQAGLRFGTSTKVGDTSIEPTLKVLAYDNVIAEGSSIAADAPGAAIVPTDQGKVRGELDPQVNFDFGNGYSSTLSGQVQFGDNLVGGAVRAQLRKQW
jgi:hypothetical protein